MNENKLNIINETEINSAVSLDCLSASRPEPFTHLDLFSGIGGFALAAKNTWGERYQSVGFCEIDIFCQKVLRKNFGEGIPIFDDIKKLKRENINGTIKLITGGFPCQPFSIAGKRKGKDDDRYLWNEMLRVIREFKPKYIVGENVTGLWSMGIENMLIEVEDEGYEVESFIIPACAVNAPHRRDRIWIIAHSYGIGGGRVQRQRKILQNKIGNSESKEEKGRVSSDKIKRNDKVTTDPYNTETSRQRGNSGEVLRKPKPKRFNLCDRKITTDNHSKHEQESIGRDKLRYERKERASGRCVYEATWEKNWIEVATEFCRVDDGIPNRVDRLKSLGNAIVPQVAEVLLAAIKTIDDNLN